MTLPTSGNSVAHSRFSERVALQERLEDKIALGLIQRSEIAWLIETLTSPDILTLLNQTRPKVHSALRHCIIRHRSSACQWNVEAYEHVDRFL